MAPKAVVGIGMNIQVDQPKILLSAPENFGAEFEYVADVVLGEFLGLDWHRAAEHSDVIRIRLVDSAGELLLNGDFFQAYSRVELSEEVLPALPLQDWNPAESGPPVDLTGPTIPVLFGRPKIQLDDQKIDIGMDIFGSIFFMLSRLEELVIPTRDAHQRFPGAASISCRAGFQERPIVDEYVEILWSCMQKLWPDLKRKRHRGKVLVSCDVDQPFDRVGGSPGRLAKSLAADIVIRRSPDLAYRRIRNFFTSPKGDPKYDPFYTFDWYLDACENEGLKAAFYFITDKPAGPIDGDYDIFDPRVLHLMKKIINRGHEIGVHGSYNSYCDPEQIIAERQKLTSAADTIGVKINPRGNRQHYLRWDSAVTPDYLADAGYDYDTTGSYADRVGFRYGTAKMFSMWSWSRRKKLRIRQRPLIVMEGTLIGKNYMALGLGGESRDLVSKLKRRSLKYGGNFSLLWHNSSLLCKRDRAFFVSAIR